jgi:hypothetical protein
MLLTAGEEAMVGKSIDGHFLVMSTFTLDFSATDVAIMSCIDTCGGSVDNTIDVTQGREVWLRFRDSMPPSNASGLSDKFHVPFSISSIMDSLTILATS